MSDRREGSKQIGGDNGKEDAVKRGRTGVVKVVAVLPRWEMVDWTVHQ